MKKLSVLFFILLISKISFSQTSVSGGIYSNTSWSLTQSPIIVTDTLTVFPGVTLTIDPGVVVKFDSDVAFNVRGTVNAIGTVTDSIIFVSNLITPNQDSWAGLIVNTEMGAAVNLNYCRISHAYRAYEMASGGAVNISIRHTVFENNYIAIAGYLFSEVFAVIDSCMFVNNTYAVGHDQISTGNFTITNSAFENNIYGFYRSEKANATNSSICGSDKAIFVERGTFDNCTIVNNITGVSCSNQHGITLINSIVAYNDTAIILHSGGINTVEPNSFYQNKICYNRVYNVLHSGTYNEDLTNNCWCTDDSTEIAISIYDGYDNANYGLIDFSAFNNCKFVFDSSSFCNSEDTPTNVFQTIQPSYFKIFPNPTDNTFFIVLSESTALDLTITDMTGRIVYSQRSNSSKLEIDSSSFSGGVYLIQLSTKENTYSSKLIKK